MRGTTKKYRIYDGDVLIGEMTGAEAGERFGVSKNRCAQYALAGTKLKGKYRVEYADQGCELKRPDAKQDELFWKEWERAVAAVKEEISVETILLKYWEKTVRPIRRKHWLWKS